MFGLKTFRLKNVRTETIQSDGVQVDNVQIDGVQIDGVQANHISHTASENIQLEKIRFAIPFYTQPSPLSALLFSAFFRFFPHSFSH